MNCTASIEIETQYISFALKDNLFLWKTRVFEQCVTSINIFYDHAKLQIIDARDDLCKIRLQLLSAIGNLKGYGYPVHFFMSLLY